MLIGQMIPTPNESVMMLPYVVYSRFEFFSEEDYFLVAAVADVTQLRTLSIFFVWRCYFVSVSSTTNCRSCLYTFRAAYLTFAS